MNQTEQLPLEDVTANRGDVFVLGAGFSNSIAGMPGLRELSRLILKTLSSSSKSELDTHFRFLPKSNFEMWLTYLSQSQPWLSEPANNRNRSSFLEITLKISEIIGAFQTSFDKPFLTMLNSKYEELRQNSPANGISHAQLVNDWLQALPGRGNLVKLLNHWKTTAARIISLNYDTLIERCWADLIIGDAKYFGYPTRLASPYYGQPQYSSNFITAFPPTLEIPFSLYKLHGSRNWFYSGSDSYFGETIFCEYVSRGNSGEQSAMLQDKVPLIIPPVTEKIPHFRNETIRNLWVQAGQQIEQASRLFFVGYSLPETDLTMRYFLASNARMVPKRSKFKPQIYVVNRNKKVAKKYKSLLSSQYDINTTYTGHDGVISDFINALISGEIEENSLFVTGKRNG